MLLHENSNLKKIITHHITGLKFFDKIKTSLKYENLAYNQNGKFTSDNNNYILQFANK